VVIVVSPVKEGRFNRTFTLADVRLNRREKREGPPEEQRSGAGKASVHAAATVQ